MSQQRQHTLNMLRTHVASKFAECGLSLLTVFVVVLQCITIVKVQMNKQVIQC